jgi:hypothetical protein
MAATWRATAEILVGDLRRVFGERLRAVVAYGPSLDGAADAPLTCLALVATLGPSDLEACAARASHWHRARLATPLLIPEDEFRRSLDAFPLEFGEILRTHEHVFGPDPFGGLAIARDDLRRACEAQVRGHLLHLREGYLESGGRPDRVAELVSASAPAFASLLRNVARLAGAAPRDRAAATREGAAAAGLDDGVAADILALEQPGAMPAADPARLFPAYLAAVEQLARYVDGWR